MFEAGDAYHVGPGHTPILYAGTEVVEFSPTAELASTMEVVTRNMEQLASDFDLRVDAPVSPLARRARSASQGPSCTRRAARRRVPGNGS